MNKHLLTIVLCIIHFLILDAQNNTNVGLSIPIIQQDQQPSNIESIEIVSDLADSTFIGVLPSIFPNARTNIVIQQGVKVWLQEYISLEFRNSFTQQGKKLLWIIKTLRLGRDSTSDKILSFVKVKADIFDGSTDFYEFTNTFDTTIVSIDNNFDLAQNLAIAISALYNDSGSSPVNEKQRLNISKSTIKAPTRADLLRSLDTSDYHNILADSIYRPGIFTSFQEFLDNSPSVTNFYADVDSNSKQVQLHEILSDSSSRIISAAWGVSINNELYRYQDGQLFAIERDGRGFALSKYLDYRLRRNQAMYWRRNIGEMQGDNNPFNDAHVYRSPIDGNGFLKVETTQLNMSSGDISNF